MKKSIGRILVANALVVAALGGSGVAMAVQVGVNVVLPVPAYVPPQPVYVAPPPVYAAVPAVVIGWQGNRYWGRSPLLE